MKRRSARREFSRRGLSRRSQSRRRPHRALGAVLWAVAALLVLARPAQAYLDPGSGSFLLQMLIGVLLGVGVTLKMYWRKITAALGSKRRRDPADPRDDS